MAADMLSRDILATLGILGHLIASRAVLMQAADSPMVDPASKEFVKLLAEHASTAQEETDADGLTWDMQAILIE